MIRQGGGFGKASYAVKRHATARSMGGARRLDNAMADYGVGGLRPRRKSLRLVIESGGKRERKSPWPGGLARFRKPQ
jgi:hypothetical protein